MSVKKRNIFLFILIIVLYLFLNLFFDNFNTNYFFYIAVLFLFLSTFFLFKKLFFIKGWVWHIIFLYLYSIAHYSVYFYRGYDDLIVNVEYGSILNNYQLNLISIKIFINYVLFLLLGALFFIFLKTFSNKKNIYTYFINKISYFKLKKYVLFLFIFIFVVLSLKKMNLSLILNSYTVGEGFSILFGAFYMFIFYLTLNYFYTKKLNIILTILIFLMFLLLGIRQLILWGFMLLFFARLIEFPNLTYKTLLKFFLVSIFLILLFGIIVDYRVNREFSLEMLNNIIKTSYLSFSWETTYTFYNFLSSLELLNYHDSPLFFLKDIKDFLILIIPSFIFTEKDNYLSLFSLKKDFDYLAPFGTFYFLGEMKLSLKYNWLLYFFAFLFGFLLEFFYNCFLIRKRDIYSKYIYSVILVFGCIYSVRSTLVSGLKLIVISLFVLLLFRLNIRNRQ